MAFYPSQSNRGMSEVLMKVSLPPTIQLPEFGVGLHPAPSLKMSAFSCQAQCNVNQLSDRKQTSFWLHQNRCVRESADTDFASVQDFVKLGLNFKK